MEWTGSPLTSMLWGLRAHLPCDTQKLSSAWESLLHLLYKSPPGEPLPSLLLRLPLNRQCGSGKPPYWLLMTEEVVFLLSSVKILLSFR